MNEESTQPLEAPDPDEPETPDHHREIDDGQGDDDFLLPEPPHPINWNVLSSDDAEYEWFALNQWVDWLRHTYGLPTAIVPPFWHRHPELVWELSALHLHWIGAYDPEQNGSAPIGWHTDFVAARERLRDWVTVAGTRLDRDRPTRQTVWPGEDVQADGGEVQIADRDEDFVRFVAADIARRRQAEEDLVDGFADEV